ncbi:probable Golgi SNAP receptor complex member 2 [Bactrocera neohumeralis]|uniref:probable Golgi SNAP receptor complex member 2 n=1 Tax=Bactrocera tryoni TaxID=59916 RepID=UPI001A99DE18|nr:probable Golgi SNAP receptor complex member 2 [Bactrocera tryoni]XP_050336685.1 probable Golgi SNAP receptor complex member 2 [Bactrocera neohumeralis]
METLYHQTNRMIQEIEQTFQKLAQTSGLDTADVENEIQMKITAVNSNCDRLDVLLYKVPASQRPSAKMRIDQLKYDTRHLQSSLQLYREKRQRRLVELSEREQLLSHRFSANNTGATETCLDIDYSLQHHTQLNNAHQGVDEMIASGGNILSSLINQRETLKGAHQRIHAIGSTLGLSNHTMKLIERRFVEDKYIMLGGMCVTLFIIGLVIYFIVF